MAKKLTQKDSQLLALLDLEGGYVEVLANVAEDDETLTGGAGNDLFIADAGDDQLDGGDGDLDTVSYAAYNKRVVADLDAGTVTTQDGTDTLINIEGVIGGSSNDLLKGGELDDLLEGMSGNDHLYGNGGNDTLFGGWGNDRLVALEGDDYLDGGTGNDQLLAGDGDNEVYGGAGNDKIVSGSGMDTLYGGDGNDKLDSGDGDDMLFGDGGKDVLFGGAGNDTLDGGSRADVMKGGTGDDTYYVDDAKDKVQENAGQGTDTVVADLDYSLEKLANVENLTLDGTGNYDGTGNSGDNVLTGNSGDNVLNGLAGDDTLFGGEGDDTFVFDNLDGIDTIEDFTTGEDVIALDSSVFKALDDGLTADNLVMGAAAVDADDYLIFNSGTGALYYDADGAGGKAAVQIAVIGVASLSIDDFSIV